MSSTRHAAEGSPFRQERYASSFESGLLANLVAKRCEEIDKHDPPQARATLWFAQWLSWQRTGWQTMVAELFRLRPLKRWRAEQRESFRYRGGVYDETVWMRDDLQRLCLDPDSSLEDAYEALESYRARWICERPAITKTAVSRRMAEALDYSRDTHCLALIDGPARTGKTFATKDWCDRSAGLARYVQVPCGNDDRAFFMAIAAALGLSCSRAYSLAEIRDRIEETLSTGDLMLVLDEAHYLWPRTRWAARPDRVNWILTALVNQGVAVALVTTPQFYTSQKRVEDFGWTSEQFIGRIGHVERLPQRLGKDDLFAVAKTLLPGGDVQTWKALAAYADLSKKHLASIEAIVKRAAWLAQQAGHADAGAADVRRAMKESIIPSDQALAESLSEVKTRRRQPANAPRNHRGSMATAPRNGGFEDFAKRREVTPDLVAVERS